MTDQEKCLPVRMLCERKPGIWIPCVNDECERPHQSIKQRFEGRDVTIADLNVGDVITIHQHGEPQQCFCVTENGERFRVRPAVDGDHPPDLTRGHWPRLWLELNTVTYEQFGGTGECHVCADGLHYNTLLTVPGEYDPSDDVWSNCHCGHDYGDHSFHVQFCRQCGCGSFHHEGENYDQITDRWN